MSSGLYNTHKIDFDTTLDLTRLKPYGDTMNDGVFSSWNGQRPLKLAPDLRRLTNSPTTCTMSAAALMRATVLMSIM